MSDAVTFVRDEYGRCLLTATFPVHKKADSLWQYMRVLNTSLVGVPTVEQVTVTQHGDRRTLASLVLVVSRTLGMRVHAEIEMSYDDDERVLRIATRRCRWGTYEATFRVVAGEGATSTVEYESAFAIMSFAGLRMPFVDAKLRAFTDQVVTAVQSSMLKSSWRDEFVATFEPMVVRTLVDAPDLAAATAFRDVFAHLERLLRYNATGGKAYRALLVRLAAESLHGGPLDSERLDDVHVAGWLLELLQAMALIADDIMDQSETRRGKACWYKAEGVGTACAINDSLLTYSATYRLLADRFGDDPPLFRKIAGLMFDTAMQTCVGQMLDTFSEGKHEHAHRARSDAIILYKTTFYTIYAPMAIGILLSRLDEDEEEALLANALRAATHIGQLFQEQDDFLDVYGDPAVTGKVGTDIVDGKATWIYAYAREKASDGQRAALEAAYGTREGEARVREMFDELGVRDEYERRQRAGSDACMAETDRRLQPIASAIVAELLHRKA